MLMHRTTNPSQSVEATYYIINRNPNEHPKWIALFCEEIQAPNATKPAPYLVRVDDEHCMVSGWRIKPLSLHVSTRETYL